MEYKQHLIEDWFKTNKSELANFLGNVDVNNENIFCEVECTNKKTTRLAVIDAIAPSKYIKTKCIGQLFVQKHKKGLTVYHESFSLINPCAAVFSLNY